MAALLVDKTLSTMCLSIVGFDTASLLFHLVVTWLRVIEGSIGAAEAALSSPFVLLSLLSSPDLSLSPSSSVCDR